MARRNPELEETWCFWSWTPDQLTERYGSLEEARARYDHLASIGVRVGLWRPNTPATVRWAR